MNSGNQSFASAADATFDSRAMVTSAGCPTEDSPRVSQTRVPFCTCSPIDDRVGPPKLYRYAASPRPGTSTGVPFRSMTPFFICATVTAFLFANARATVTLTVIMSRIVAPFETNVQDEAKPSFVVSRTPFLD